MNKLLILFLVIVALSQLHLSAENKSGITIANEILNKHGKFKIKPDYNLYKKYRTEKNWENALPVIAYLYINPDIAEQYIIKGFADTLFKLEKYNDAVQIYKEVPTEYQYLITKHMMVLCYFKLDKYLQAKSILKEELPKKSYDKYAGNLIMDLLNYGEELAGYELIYDLETYFLAFYKKNDAAKLPVIKFKMIYLYHDYYLNLLLVGDYNKSIKVIEKMIALQKTGMEKYKKYINETKFSEDIIIRDALNYYRDNNGQKKEGNFKLLITHFARVEMSVPGDGVKKNEMKDDDPQKMKRNVEAMRILYFYFTKGELVIDYDFEVFDGTITSYNKYFFDKKAIVVDHRYTKPDPKNYFESKLDKYDGFINVIPFTNKNKYPTNVGGKKNVYTGGLEEPLVYANQQGAARYYMINWVHEFYHSIERMYKIKDKHIYREVNKDKWPDWYDGLSELSYLKGFFEHNPFNINMVE